MKHLCIFIDYETFDLQFKMDFFEITITLMILVIFGTFCKIGMMEMFYNFT
jgi:hypothetical protein